MILISEFILFIYFFLAVKAIWFRLGIIKVVDIPVGQLVAFLLTYYFQKRLFFTVLFSKGLVLFNKIIHEINESIKQRKLYNDIYKTNYNDYEVQGGL